MEYKIIQIIQAPENMRVVYQRKGKPNYSQRVVCLALVEDQFKERTVKPMDCSSDGDFDFCDEDINFKEIIFPD